MPRGSYPWVHRTPNPYTLPLDQSSIYVTAEDLVLRRLVVKASLVESIVDEIDKVAGDEIDRAVVDEVDKAVEVLVAVSNMNLMDVAFRS